MEQLCVAPREYNQIYLRTSRLRSRRRPLSAILDRDLISQMPCGPVPQAILPEGKERIIVGGRRYDQGQHHLFLIELSANIATAKLGVAENILRLRLMANLSEHQVMAESVARKQIVSPLIYKGFRVHYSRMARGDFAASDLNHQIISSSWSSQVAASKPHLRGINRGVPVHTAWHDQETIRRSFALSEGVYIDYLLSVRPFGVAEADLGSILRHKSCQFSLWIQP
jgi:hypothetical protein